jgi:hypothetical protein
MKKRYLFMGVESGKIIDRLALPSNKEAFRVAAQISRTTNEQIVVLRAIAIVDERLSATLTRDDEVQP